MNIFRINTTAWEEEDFYLLTDLSEQDIVEVITPLVNQERDGYEEYDNESLFWALKERFPDAYIEFYQGNIIRVVDRLRNVSIYLSI